MAKRSELAPLDQVRVDLVQRSVELQPLTHQVSALPRETDLEYYFIPHEHMTHFSALHQAGHTYKNLKLINYGQPAIALSFFFKHKYSIERNASILDATSYVKEHRDYLYSLSFLEKLSASQEEELRHADELLRTLRQNPEGYQFCFSNYHHYYRYWYCAYRFFEDDQQLKTTTLNEHLLKYTKGSESGPPQQRLNIIFVHTDYITRPIPYDNKLVDRELESYPERFTHGTISLHFRKLTI